MFAGPRAWVEPGENPDRRLIVEMTSIPSFCAGVQFKYVAARNDWVLLAPERLFQPDEHSVEILKLIDGVRNLETIIADLARRFDAPQDLITGDVTALLQNLIDKGVVRL